MGICWRGSLRRGCAGEGRRSKINDGIKEDNFFFYDHFMGASTQINDRIEEDSFSVLCFFFMTIWVIFLWGR